MKKLKNNAFTLVELIVIITIISILGTIAFLSIQGYSKNARDSVRTTDLGNIQKSLELYITKTGKYPEPSNSESITYSGSLAWKQGTFGNEPFKQLGDLNKLPIDPLTNSEYTYSITSNNTEYQVSAVYEGEISKNKELLNKSYAESKINGLSKIVGTYNGRRIYIQTGSYNFTIFTPTIINGDLSKIDLQEIITNNKLVINGKSKLPDSYKNTIFKDNGIVLGITNILISTGSIQELKSNSQSGKYLRRQYLENFQNILSGSLLENNYSELTNLDTNSEDPKVIDKIDSLVINIVDGKLGGNNSLVNLQKNNNCTIGGQTIINGENITAYNTSNVPYGSTCTGITRNCDKGILDGSGSYIYTSCSVGTGSNCTSTTYSGAIITDLSHGESQNFIKTISNGTGDVTATCTNGVISYGSVNTTCETNYIQSGLWNCVLDSCLGNAPSNSQLNGSQGTASWSYGTTPGICKFICQAGYYWNGIDTCVPASAGHYVTTSGLSSQTASTTGQYQDLTAQTTYKSCSNKPDNSVYTSSTALTTNSCPWSCDSGFYQSGNTCTTYVNGACTSLPSNALYYNSTTSYSLTNANNGTTLSAVIAGYSATPAINTCQFKCSSNYSWDGSSCTDSEAPTITGIVFSYPFCGTARITINGADDNIGLNSTPYSFDGGVTWQSNNYKDEYGVNVTKEAGQIKVRDLSGNIYTYNSFASGVTPWCSISGSFGSNASGATVSVCGSNVTANSSGNFTTTKSYGSTCNNITATKSGYNCSTTTNGPSSLNSDFTTSAGNCTLNSILGCENSGQIGTATTSYNGCDTPDIILCTGLGAGYTISSCNVGTNTAGTGSSSYGYYFQWGNNGGTPSGNVTPSTTLVNASSYGPGNYYNNTTFIAIPGISPNDWTNPQNNNLWGDTTNTSSARQGPCANGYHIPSQSEWSGIISAGGWGGKGNNMRDILKIPFGGDRHAGNGTMRFQGTYGYYWSSSIDSSISYYSYYISIGPTFSGGSGLPRGSSYNVRCIKN